MNQVDSTTAPFALEMARFIRAPRDKVFDAFTNPVALRAWYCPRGLRVKDAQFDARPGGRWQVVMEAYGGKIITVGGVVESIERPARLVHTWQWESGGIMPAEPTHIEITFTEQDGGTYLKMRHIGFATATVRDAHSSGWRSQYDRLVGLLDPRGSAATLTLLGVPRSSFTRTVRMGFCEKGVAYTLQEAMPHTAQVQEVNPFGRIPALKDGELAIFETSAILRYIDEGFEGPPLWPIRLVDRVRCEQWMSAISSYVFNTMITRFVRQHYFPTGAGGQPDRDIVDGALAEIPRQLAILDKAYGTGSFLAGEAVSAADLLLAPILHYVESLPAGAALLAAAPNVQRAQGVMRARRSFIETQP